MKAAGLNAVSTLVQITKQINKYTVLTYFITIMLYIIHLFGRVIIRYRGNPILQYIINIILKLFIDKSQHLIV